MELEMEMGTDLESYTNNDRDSSITRSALEQSEESEGQEVNLELDIDSERPREGPEEECSTSVGTIRFAPSSVGTSASILSMPDPLYSSFSSFSEPSIIHSDSISVSELVSEYTSEFSSGMGSRIPSRQGSPSPPHQHMPGASDDANTHTGVEVEHEAYSGGDPDTESDDLEVSDSESSFPSVTSSFFFSSPASQGVGEEGLSHEESNGEESHEEGESSSSRGLRATQGLIIPSLALPESLLLPTPRPRYEERSSAAGFPTTTSSDSRSNVASSPNRARLQDGKDTLRFLVVSTQSSVSEHVAKELFDWENSEVTQHSLQWEDVKVEGTPLMTRIFRRSVYGIDAASAAEIYCVSLSSASELSQGEDTAMILKRLVFGSSEQTPFSAFISGTKDTPLDVKGKGKANVLGDAELQTSAGPLFTAMILIEPDVDGSGQEDLTNASLKFKSAIEGVGDLKDLLPTIHLHLWERKYEEPGTHSHTHPSILTTPPRTSSSVAFQPSAAHHRTSYQPQATTSAGGTGYVYEQSLPLQPLDTMKTKPTKLGNKRRLSSFSKSQAWTQAQEQIKSEMHPDSLDAVWGVSALQQVLFHDPCALATLRNQASERWTRWATLQKAAKGQMHVVEDEAWRRHGQEETIIGALATAIPDTSRSLPDSNWREFKAAWEASWEGMSGEEAEEQISREVPIRLRESPSSSPMDDMTRREDDLLRTLKLSPKPSSYAARVPLADPYSNVTEGKGTLRARRRANISRDAPLSSPSLATALPTASFVSSSESKLSPVAAVPLAAGFPFPSSVHSHSLDPRPQSQTPVPRSRDSDSSRSSSDIEPDSPLSSVSISIPRAQTKSHNPPIIIDLHAAAFDPLHLPSLFLFSLSLLGPLRARMVHTISAAGSGMRDGIARVFWAGKFRQELGEDDCKPEDESGIELHEVTSDLGREHISDSCSLSVSSYTSEEPQSFAKTILFAGASFLLGVGVGVGLGLLSGRFCRVI